MTKVCKYYKPEMEELLQMCRLLYHMPECGAGGLLHILLDDNNYDDLSIAYCLKACLLNREREEAFLGIEICLRYLKLTMEERSVFDCIWNGQSEICSFDPAKCEQCEKLADYYENMKDLPYVHCSKLNRVIEN